MSRATKRKHVTREVLDDYVLPEEKQQIVQVVAPRGNNLHEVKTPSGDKFLASMPTKFRKNVWIKRGDFVIVDPIEEGDKVKGEISVILFPKQIKFIQKEGLWPEEFLHQDRHNQECEDNINQLSKKLEKATLTHEGEEYSDSEDDNDDDLFINTNRPPVMYYEESLSEDDEDDEEATDEDESSVDH